LKRLLLILLLSSSASFSCILDDLGITSKVGGNENVPARKVTVFELSYMYCGKIKTWSDGTKVQVLVRPYSDYDQKSLIMTVLGMSMSAFKEHVARNVNIRLIKDKYSMLEELGKTKGAIGIISDEELYLSTDKGVVRLELVE
jgi:hypothetical protein